MLDTDTVSFALRGHGRVAAEVARRRRSELCVSAISVAELRYGADRRGSRKIHRTIDVFLSAVLVMSFDDAAAARFGAQGVALFVRAKHVVRVARALPALKGVVPAADNADAVRQKGRERRTRVARASFLGQRRIASLGQHDVDDPAARDDVGLSNRAEAAR